MVFGPLIRLKALLSNAKAYDPNQLRRKNARPDYAYIEMRGVKSYILSHVRGKEPGMPW